MELAGFQPRERSGDQLPAKEAVDRPLVVQVREHRTGVITKFKPEGGEAIVVDAADTATDSVWLDIMWMNGALVDNLAPYVGQAVPIKLTWTAGAQGGYPYIGVTPLEGGELTAAQQWATANPTRFDTERAHRSASGTSGQQATPAPAPAATVADQQPAPSPAPTQQPDSGQQQAADPNDPAVKALLNQINSGQQPPS